MSELETPDKMHLYYFKIFYLFIFNQPKGNLTGITSLCVCVYVRRESQAA